jgi:hypothetical protein
MRLRQAAVIAATALMPVAAQEPKPAGPTPAAIIEKHLAAIGGRLARSGSIGTEEEQSAVWRDEHVHVACISAAERGRARHAPRVTGNRQRQDARTRPDPVPAEEERAAVRGEGGIQFPPLGGHGSGCEDPPCLVGWRLSHVRPLQHARPRRRVHAGRAQQFDDG